jgi:hypothetical protein
MSKPRRKTPLEKKLQQILNSNLEGEGATQLRATLHEALDYIDASYDPMVDEDFRRELKQYLIEGNSDLETIRALRMTVLGEEQKRVRNQIKALTLQLVNNFKSKPIPSLAGLCVAAIAASLNDVSLLTRAKQIARIGGAEE